MAGISTYIKSSYDELIHKVTWPTWSELQQSSVLVFIASVIIALLVFGMDYAFGRNPGNDNLWDGLVGVLYRLISA